MKKILLLLTIFFNINASPNGATEMLALSSVGFLAPAMLCAVQATFAQGSLLLDRPYEPLKTTLIHSRNFYLKGMAVAIPGVLLLSFAEAHNTKRIPVWPFVLMASGMFAMAGSAYIESLKYQKEFERTQNDDLAVERDKWREVSRLFELGGCVVYVTYSLTDLDRFQINLGAKKIT